MTLDSRTAGSLLLALASVFSSVEAAPVAVFTGNLTTDDDVFLTTFSITTPGTYRIESWSYAGGTMSDGSVVPSGGFDAVLTVFDAAGEFLAGDDDGFFDRFDPTNGKAFDAGFDIMLDAGDYTLAITQYDNEWNALDEFFTRAGEGNFTPALRPSNPCTATSFCDFSETGPRARTSFFAVDVTPAPVPVPPALALFATGLAGLAWRAGRHAART